VIIFFTLLHHRITGQAPASAAGQPDCRLHDIKAPSVVRFISDDDDDDDDCMAAAAGPGIS